MKYTGPASHPTNNCPIRQHTADGVSVGRCWHFLGRGDTKICRIHGDVTEAVKTYANTGRLTNDRFAERDRREETADAGTG